MYHDGPRPVSLEPDVRLHRFFGAIVAFEAVYYVIKSIAHMVRLNTDYSGWPLGLFFVFLWPTVLIGATYVLWHPKLPESRREAVLRSALVWGAVVINLLHLLAFLYAPGSVIRWPTE